MNNSNFPNYQGNIMFILFIFLIIQNCSFSFEVIYSKLIFKTQNNVTFLNEIQNFCTNTINISKMNWPYNDLNYEINESDNTNYLFSYFKDRDMNHLKKYSVSILPFIFFSSLSLICLLEWLINGICLITPMCCCKRKRKIKVTNCSFIFSIMMHGGIIFGCLFGWMIYQ